MTVNRLQQTTYCTKVGHTRSTRFFFAFHKLLKRYMKAQQLVQWYLVRCLGTSGIHQSRCTRRTRNCCCPDRAYLRSTQEKQLLGYQFYCFQYVVAVFFQHRYQLYYFQYVAADVFYFLVTVVLFLVCSKCLFFFLSSNHFAQQNLRRTERKYRWTDSKQFLESFHPTDSVVFRTYRPITELYFRQILSTDFMNRLFFL